MPRVFMGAGRIQAVTLGNYFTVGSAPSSVNYGTEANIARVARVPGTFSRLSVNFDANGTARSVQFRKNSADATLVVSPADSTATTTTDTTHFVAVANGDTFDLKFVGTAPAFSCNVLGVNFSANSGHAGYIASTANAYSTTAFSGMFSGSTSATEANIQAKMRTAGTVKGGQAAVNVASSATATMTNRINGANGAIAVSISAGVTGIFEDNTNTATFVVGDLLNWNITNVGTTLTMQALSVIQYSSPKNEVSMLINPGITFSTSTQYLPIVGSAIAITATEGNAQIAHGFKVKATKMRAYVSVNNFGSTMTCKIRKNGGDGNQSLAITAAGTGWFEDASNVDTFDPTDLVNYSVSGGTSGSCTCAGIMITETPADYLPNIAMIGL